MTVRNATSRIDGQPPHLKITGLTRRFGDVVANDGLSLEVKPGEVVGLLGENGAGKSTLLAALAGFGQPDAGEIRIDGNVVVLGSPADAIRVGIGTVFQHFALVPVFTVREQMRLSGALSRSAWTLLDDIDLDQRVADLSVGERQRLEIARVLVRRPRLLLLDEPTSTLSASQVEDLFDVMRELRREGAGVVFVTHKLPEALSIADRLLVMRQGAIVAEVARDDPNAHLGGWEPGIEARLLRAMFGGMNSEAADIAGVGSVASGPEARGEADGANRSDSHEPLLKVSEASALISYGRHRPVDITFAVRPGTTLAIVGIDGQGQRELAELLAGHLPSTGSIRVAGREVGGMGAAERQRLGVGYLTDDRVGEGGIPDLTVALNLVLTRQRRPEFQRFGILRNAAIQNEGRRLVDRWGVAPPSPSSPMGTLSGGNMQKVLLGREMELHPSVLIASNPAHGLDLRTQDLVWDALGRVTAGGGAVVLLTPDITEALTHADEVAVLAAGRLSPALPVSETDQGTLSQMIVSGW